MDLLNLESLNLKPNMTNDEKKGLMLTLLRDKFSKEEYKEELLKTGDMVLHEKPMRGVDNWTYKDGKGGDWRK